MLYKFYTIVFVMLLHKIDSNTYLSSVLNNSSFKFQEGRLSFTSGLHNFGSSLSNNVTTASGSTSSSQNYTDLSLSHLTSSWNQQGGGHGGPGGQDSRHVGGPGTNTPSISLSTAASHTIPQLSITSSTLSPQSNSPADGKRKIF